MITDDIRPGPATAGAAHGQAAPEAACASARDGGSPAGAPITIRRRSADDFADWQALCLGARTATSSIGPSGRIC